MPQNATTKTRSLEERLATNVFGLSFVTSLFAVAFESEPRARASSPDVRVYNREHAHPDSSGVGVDRGGGRDGGVARADHQQSDSRAGRKARPRRRDSGRRPAARYARAAAADRRRQPGRLGAGQFRARCAGRPPLRQRLARRSSTCSTATTSRRSTPTSRPRSRSPSTTGSRAASSASTSIRSSRRTACSTRCTPSARRATRRRRTSFRRGSPPRDATLSQRHHRVACEEPGREHVRGHAARAAARRAHRREPDAPDGRRRVQPDGQARLAGLRPALHQRQRPRVQQRRRTAQPTIRRRRSGSTRSSAAILRIDPRSPSVSRGTKGLGDYTIPPANVFAADGDPKRWARSTPTGSATRTACRGT